LIGLARLSYDAIGETFPHATGLPIAQMNTPPVLQEWTVWRIDMGSGNVRRIDVAARDEGAGWGQWLGMAVLQMDADDLLA
jgi:hypothetical protein